MSPKMTTANKIKVGYRNYKTNLVLSTAKDWTSLEIINENDASTQK
jgi:hypothetical protein